MSFIFVGSYSLYYDIDFWNVININDIVWIISNVESFNKDICSWDFVTNICCMLSKKKIFNTDIIV